MTRRRCPVQVHKCNQFSLARNETYNAAYVRHIEASRSADPRPALTGTL